MRGEMVIIRAYGGVPLVRRFWEANDRVIYITNDEQLRLLMNGEKAVSPIGFPKKDVFKFDRKIAHSISTTSSDEFDWGKLTPLITE